MDSDDMLYSERESDSDVNEVEGHGPGAPARCAINQQRLGNVNVHLEINRLWTIG